MKPRTTVDLLEPATSPDQYTGDQVPDWNKPPTEHPSPASVEPISSSEQVLTSGTVIERWLCYLPPGTAVEPFWRVRWEGDDYEIDGAVERWQGRRGETYRSVLLKLVEG